MATDSSTPDTVRLAQRLRRVVRGEVLFDEPSRALYAVDASLRNVAPLGVVVPRDRADVIATLALAREMGCPVLPRGAGTSFCGPSVGPALLIDPTRYLNHLVRLDLAGGTITVEPGVVLEALNAFLRPHGLWFPVDVTTSAQATVGGMVGNDSTGLRAPKYGDMVHGVVAIEALLGDGAAQRFAAFGVNAREPLPDAAARVRVSRLFECMAGLGPLIRRDWPLVQRCPGGLHVDVFHPDRSRPYTTDGSVNLAHLLVGSAGSLAWSDQIQLKLSPLPAQSIVGVVHCSSMGQVTAVLPELARVQPAALDMLERRAVEQVRALPAHKAVLDDVLGGSGVECPAILLLAEFSGDDPDALLRQCLGLADFLPDARITPLVGRSAQRALWAARQEIIAATMRQGPFSVRGAGNPQRCPLAEYTVPLPALDGLVHQVEALYAEQGLMPVFSGQLASVGVRLRVMPEARFVAGMPRDPRFDALSLRTMERVWGVRGVCEVGPFDLLRPATLAQAQFGPELANAFRAVRALFDPSGVLLGPPGSEPGGTPEPSGPSGAAAGSAGVTRSGGPLAGPLDRLGDCTGQAGCLRLAGGMICPSYRVTRDRRHSPLGRVAILRHSGPLGLAGNPVDAAFGLCNGCRACRTECASGIDLQQIRLSVTEARVRAGRDQSGPRGRRARLMLALANCPESRWRWLAPLVNARNRARPLAWLADRFLGWSLQRRWPVVQGRFRSGSARVGDEAARVTTTHGLVSVAFWSDPLHRRWSQESLHDAVWVLRRLGHTVSWLEPAAADPAPDVALASGRTALRLGYREQARHQVLRVLAALRRARSQGAVVVVADPACITTLRQDWSRLGLTPEDLELAADVRLFSEFLAQQHPAMRFPAGGPTPDSDTVWLLAQCQQQACGLVDPALGLMRRFVPEVRRLDAGCCGMGDTFGLEAATADMAVRMAHQGPLGALGSARHKGSGRHTIVTEGPGCKHHLAEAGRWPVESLAAWLRRQLAGRDSPPPAGFPG